MQPASLDLRLGEVAYRIRCSFLPDTQTVERKAKDYIFDELDLRKEGVVLETNRPYLIPLKERLALPPSSAARPTPRARPGGSTCSRGSSPTRASASTRSRPATTARSISRSCRCRSRCGSAKTSTLNQLRLSVGRTELTDDDIRELHRDRPLLFSGGEPVPVDQLALANGMFLSLDLRGDANGSGRATAPARTHRCSTSATTQPVDASARTGKASTTKKATASCCHRSASTC